MQMPILRTDAENRHRLLTLLRRGEIVRVHRGIYVPARLATIPEIRAGAACAAVPCGVASHDTAAALWNIELVTPSGAEHVTVPVARRRASWSTLTVHASDLRPEDVVEWRELRATSPLRTVRDLLRTCDRLTGVWAVEQALACKVIGRDELVADLRSLAARRSCSLADERSESPLETGIRLTLIDAGLPAPELQIPIRDGAFRIDMGYRKRRIGIEADGRAVHDVPKAIYADRRRKRTEPARLAAVALHLAGPGGPTGVHRADSAIGSGRGRRVIVGYTADLASIRRRNPRFRRTT